jgi:hypothetical protein
MMQLLRTEMKSGAWKFHSYFVFWQETIRYVLVHTAVEDASFP